MFSGDILYYSGIAMMSLTVVLSIAAVILFKGRTRHLKNMLDREYGKHAEQEKSFH